MGRCNNRRTQQAAEAMRDTPARARFSKQRNNHGRGNNPGRGNGERQGGRGNNNDTAAGRSVASTSNCSDGRTNTAAKIHSQVVSKVAQRVVNQQNKSSHGGGVNQSTLHGRDPLRGIDASKLDEIQLSEETINAIADILGQLQVVKTHQTEEDQKLKNPGRIETTTPDSNDTGTKHDENNQGIAMDSARIFLDGDGAGGYVEYEDDFDDSKIVEERNEQRRAVEPDQERHDPVFMHLTRTLSFPDDVAIKACQAIESWGTGKKSSNGGDSASSPKMPKDHAARMTIAMDWLCLHLSEYDLNLGFRPNPGAVESQSSFIPRTNIVTKYKAVPHESISVATKLTDDMEWQRSNRLQRRVVDFIKLGFHYKDALTACESVPVSNDDVPAHRDWQTLEILLSQLEQETLGKDEDVVGEEDDDHEDAKLDREQELEALAAIYESNVEWWESNAERKEVCVKVTLEQQHNEERSESQNVLFILMRHGYPLHKPPLMMFYNPHSPAPLLLRVNEALIQHADSIMTGQPLIFDVVSYIVEGLGQIQKDFQLEQELCSPAGTETMSTAAQSGNTDYEAEDLEDAPLGRRRKARLKSAEKAHDYSETMERQEMERKKRQAERIEVAQMQQANLRQTLADRVIREREVQRFQEALKRLSRTAMSDALNRGETVEQARLAASRAEKQYIQEHGTIEEGFGVGGNSEGVVEPEAEETAPSEGGDDGLEAVVVRKSLKKSEEGMGSEIETKVPDEVFHGESTAVTKAFMDRLRGMYSDAQKRGPYDLRDPATGPKSDESNGELGLPCPIPSRAGDITSIMEDVLRLQNDQPWLVSDEARVPTKHETVAPLDQDTQIASNVELSNALRTERHRLWSSQRFKRILSQREKLPAYSMREEIAAAIREHQVVVVSGATGMFFAFYGR